MAKTKVADYVISRLQQWGIEYVFGYPGDGINGLMGALNRAGNKPQFIQARHEEMAAFEATGYAKFTDKVGVCMATSGPGAIHLLNGLYDAKLDHAPVVAIVGQQARTALGGNYQQEVDLISLFKDVASDYVHMATTAQQFPLLIDRAIRIAISQRAPTCVIIPADLQEEPYEAPEHSFKQMLTSDAYSTPRVVPHPDDLRRAAEILNAGSKVAMLVGQGARGARREVMEVADVLGAGIAKALLGKDVLPDTEPIVTGPIGLLGTKPSYDLMMECDTFLMVGSSFPYSQFLPGFGDARGVQIDIDAKLIGMRYPMEVNLVGDAASTLQALLPLLERKTDRSWQDKIKKEVARWREVEDSRAHLEANPINPQLLFAELSTQLPDDAIVTSDAGSAANWYARHIQFRGDMRGSLSGTLATMGPAVPYAIGAKFGNPRRPVIATTGDGAMQMNGINELITIAKYFHEWADPRLVVLVLHNNDLNQVTWEMRAMAGDPKFEASQNLPPFDYARYAELVGLQGIHVDKPEQVAGAWRQALGADRPVVIDAVTDPEVPPLPPHVELDEAKALLSAILKGDPASAEIVRQGAKGKLQEFLHRR